MDGLFNTRIPTIKEIFTGSIYRNGNWVVACVKPNVGWPVKVTEILFRGQTIFLIPPTINEGDHPYKTYPAIAILLRPGLQFEDGQIVISHFLSSLSWATESAILVEEWTGGNLPRPMSGFTGPYGVVPEFYQPYLPDSQDQNTRLALAFYREGLGLNHVAYQCLSFFKILNIFLRSGKDQEDWMNANIPNITDFRAKQRISFLQANRPNVGQYLYGSNRCAVAHAGGQPTADPEDPRDMRRLHEDLPLVRALAEYAIENQFGIKSRATEYREHLYELEGFRTIFGPEKVAALKSAGELSEADWPSLPRLSVKLTQREAYAPLENLSAEIVECADGSAHVQCASDDGLTHLVISLNFRAERLEIDIMDGLGATDDGSEHAARQGLAVTRFQLDYIMNGILQVWDSENNRLLGRRDAYIPMNIDMDGTHRNFSEIIQHMEAEADRRSVASSVGNSTEESG